MNNTVRFSSHAYETLKRTVGSCLPESGAIIGAPADGNGSCITQARFDSAAGWGRDFYAPSEEIGCVLAQWAQDRIRFWGIVHSHGSNCPNKLSPIDLRSALSILQLNAMPFIYMGLFHRGEFTLYRVLPDGSTETMQTVLDAD